MALLDESVFAHEKMKKDVAKCLVNQGKKISVKNDYLLNLK